MSEFDKLHTALQSVRPERLAILAPFLTEAVERFTSAANAVGLGEIEAADLIRLQFVVELRVGDELAERSVIRGRFYEAHPR